MLVSKRMTKDPVTAISEDLLIQAQLKMKKGGFRRLPVVERGRLVGIITTSDVLHAFLDVIGASEETSTRIDFVLQGEGRGFAEASKIVSQEGGEVLGVGTYRGRWGENPVCYLRLRSADAEAVAKVLREKGFDVLGVHQVGGAS